MERYVKERWNDNKRDTIAQLFGAIGADLIVLDGSESFVYEYTKDGKSYILRVGHSDRRNETLIQAEVDWINYLANNGAQVASAILSDNGNLVEILDDGYGAQFLATAFHKAQGSAFPHDDWTPQFIQHYGQTIAQLHRLSQEYTPTNPQWQRYHWGDSRNLDYAQYEGIIESEIIAKANAIYERLRAIPKDENYHMIHQDAHSGNFYVDDNGRITLFDFDDCMYGYAVDDIAMCLFYGPVRGDLAVANTFITNFIKGYIKQSEFVPAWLDYIPDFMRLREIDLYGMIERDIDWRNGEDWWATPYMQGRRERLLNDVPFVDFDFQTLADLIS